MKHILVLNFSVTGNITNICKLKYHTAQPQNILQTSWDPRSNNTPTLSAPWPSATPRQQTQDSLNSLPPTYLEGQKLPDVHGASVLAVLCVCVCAGQPSLAPLPPPLSLNTGDQHSLSRSALYSKLLLCVLRWINTPEKVYMRRCPDSRLHHNKLTFTND